MALLKIPFVLPELNRKKADIAIAGSSSVTEDLFFHSGWAVATRSQWDKDLVVLPGMMGTRLDPSGSGISTTKGGLDATQPSDKYSFAQRLSIPSSVMGRIRLKDFLDPEGIR